jgi:biopolymer transport protein TolR
VIATGLRGRAGPRAGRRGPGKQRRPPQPGLKADINVTPLVDVVLVLLIIFMVVTPMLSKGVNVDLPLTDHHDKRNDDNRDIVVAITQRGEVYLGPAAVGLEALGGAVAAERQRHPDKQIFLKGDTRIEYGTARRVMEAIHRAGVADIQLGTEERSNERSHEHPAGGRP